MLIAFPLFIFFEVVPYYLLQLVDNVYKALPLTFRHTGLNLPQKAPFVSSLIFWVIFNYFFKLDFDLALSFYVYIMKMFMKCHSYS